MSTDQRIFRKDSRRHVGECRFCAPKAAARGSPAIVAARTSIERPREKSLPAAERSTIDGHRCEENKQWEKQSDN